MMSSIIIYIPHYLNVLVYILCQSSSNSWATITGLVLKREREDISLQSGLRDLSKSYANEIKKDEWSCLANQNMNDGTNTQV